MKSNGKENERLCHMQRCCLGENAQEESDDTASNHDKEWDMKAAVKSEMGEISKKTVDTCHVDAINGGLHHGIALLVCSKIKLLPSMWSKDQTLCASARVLKIEQLINEYFLTLGCAGDTGTPKNRDEVKRR